MMIIRASIGTLAKLGLVDIKVGVKQKTAYLLQYSPSGCMASCIFCGQGKLSRNRDKIARITWPPVSLRDFLRRLSERRELFKRICIQTVLKKGFFEELLQILSELKRYGVVLPISVALTPIEKCKLSMLKDLGVECVGVGLDVASKHMFSKMGKPYSWDIYWNFIKTCSSVFNPQSVYVHLIYGLPVSDQEFIETMERIYEYGVNVALFAFTPVPGTPLENLKPPPLVKYRLMQIVNYLLRKGYRVNDFMKRSKAGEILIEKSVYEILGKEEIVNATLTSGCPNCDRPFFDSSPKKMYNYPNKDMALSDWHTIASQLRDILEA